MNKEKADMIEVDDLQNQVREHIKAHDLFDWHEALTENEMTLLENLLLTFAPMFRPGSIGFAKTVQPYLDIAGRTVGSDEIEKLKDALRDLALQYKMVVSEQLERIAVNFDDEIDQLPAYKKAIELLKTNNPPPKH